MHTRFFAALLLLGVAAAAAAQAPASASTPAPAAAARDASLPPPEDQARAALEKSPRHGEYIDVKMSSSTARICRPQAIAK